MFRKLGVLSVALLLCMLVAGPALAGPMTLEGKVVCAKCALHEEGREECQNVLVVESKGEKQHYYMTKNAAYEKLGEVCKGATQVRVTGEVSEKDGKHWIAATEITPLDKKS
jgi:hypothetical protein